MDSEVQKHEYAESLCIEGMQLYTQPAISSIEHGFFQRPLCVTDKGVVLPQEFFLEANSQLEETKPNLFKKKLEDLLYRGYLTEYIDLSLERQKFIIKVHGCSKLGSQMEIGLKEEARTAGSLLNEFYGPNTAKVLHSERLKEMGIYSPHQLLYYNEELFIHRTTTNDEITQVSLDRTGLLCLSKQLKRRLYKNELTRELLHARARGRSQEEINRIKEINWVYEDVNVSLEDFTSIIREVVGTINLNNVTEDNYNSLASESADIVKKYWVNNLNNPFSIF